MEQNFCRVRSFKSENPLFSQTELLSKYLSKYKIPKNYQQFKIYKDITVQFREKQIASSESFFELFKNSSFFIEGFGLVSLLTIQSF